LVEEVKRCKTDLEAIEVLRKEDLHERSLSGLSAATQAALLVSVLEKDDQIEIITHERRLRMILSMGR